MSIRLDLAGIARREWIRWGGPVEKIDGQRLGFTHKRMEAQHPFWVYVGEYWRAAGSSLDGRDKPPWSGAFICYCFREANAGDRFPYSDNHSRYMAAIDGGQHPGLTLVDVATARLEVGDLLWASRTGDECRRPPATFASAHRELTAIRNGTASTFCSHSDIVVDVRPGEVDVIGGNVSQAVTRTTYRLDTKGQVRDGRRSFLGVLKNAL
ncbi:DUF2272 domain-containing protein [Methylobacterium nonmethylotrophicum]|uniref:DUF2272 domain-containing protein n=1 Tax=Methylobacterium nonmethylotrophicum TaxID=1141884 RepID=A0A4Z0NIY5_9HYPH|nr:DUF2272 domain-containing protein [Methylobacterium nonmethylotrophicum]TGD95692.1 DUF2272 domain-containing protein [Methylobacterium nonmethylotrophicum]